MGVFNHDITVNHIRICPYIPNPKSSQMIDYLQTKDKWYDFIVWLWNRKGHIKGKHQKKHKVPEVPSEETKQEP